MEIRFKLSPAEHSEAIAHLWKPVRSRSGKLFSIIYGLCCGLATFGFITIYKFLDTYQQDDANADITQYVLIFMVIIFIILIILNYSGAKFLRNKFLSSAKSLLSEQLISVEPDFLLEKINHSEYRTSWKDIVRIEETPKYIYLFKDDSIANYIPKRIFNTEDELEAFINILREKIKIGQSLT